MAASFAFVNKNKSVAIDQYNRVFALRENHRCCINKDERSLSFSIK